MKLKSLLYFITGLIATTIVSCNASDTKYYDIEDATGASAAYVNSFKLAADTSVLARLDTVFFTIDLNEARIFNADSLPKGTDVSKLVVKIGLPSVGEAKLLIPAETGEVPDTIDYLTNSTDSVCFSRGPVTLRIVSHNQEVTRDYKISVNVHKVLTDTLTWSQTAQAELPTSLSLATSQGTVEMDGSLLTLTYDGRNGSIATTDDPFNGNWTAVDAVVPAGAKANTLTAIGTNLYLVASDQLYTSSDKGLTWNATGASMTNILGTNDETLLGIVKNSDGTYSHVTYPATEVTPASADFPVSGASQPLKYTSEWAAEPMTIIMGGMTADDKVTGAVWGYYDGTWAKISNQSVPDITGMTLIPYFTVRVDGAWVATTSAVLLAFGGQQADGKMNNTTYMSKDMGVNWVKANKWLNLPSDILSLQGRQAFVIDQTYPIAQTASAQGIWKMLQQPTLPAAYTMEGFGSRASKPIEEWECPFIYLFGGHNQRGEFNRSIWRGVITRLTFKPIQ